MKEGGVVQVAPVLPEDVRQQVLALAEARLLAKLVTSWVPVTGAVESLLRWSGVRVLAGRRAAPVRGRWLRRVPAADFAEQVTRLLGGGSIEAVDRRFSAVDSVAGRAIQASSRAVLAREDACLASFGRAALAGIPCLYDLPTVHHDTVRRLLERESALFPDDCAASNQPGEFSPARTRRKDAELAAADFILCPSTLVSDSLVAAGIPERKIFALPLAAEPAWLTERASAREPVFLYVGQISLRKGVHRLLRAWKRLKAYRTHRLRLVGAMRLTEKFLGEFTGLYEHVPFVARDRLAEHYSRAQALVFNALADGFGMVVVEAMSCGTPALVSENSGAAMVVSSGENGWRFPYGDDEALMATLEWALAHPAALAEMGELARRRSAEWTWFDYRKAFVEWIQRVQRGGR